MDGKRELLTHFLASLAYRSRKALDGAPPGYSAFRAAPGARTPHELVWHMSNVLGYARTFFAGGVWRPPMLEDFDEEVLRFHGLLMDLARHFEKESSFQGMTPERMLKAPLADAMTHAGQLALVRRLAGSPLVPESFVKAEMDPRDLGPGQPPGRDRG